MIPKQIDKPCFFYVKQGDMSFRGDWSMLMAGNVPKPAYNVARMFNSLRGKWVDVSGGSDDLCAVAAIDEHNQRLAILITNFRFRHSSRRHLGLATNNLPTAFYGGEWREWLVDSQHSNVFYDANHGELEMTDKGKIGNQEFVYSKSLLANSVVMLELVAKKE